MDESTFNLRSCYHWDKYYTIDSLCRGNFRDFKLPQRFNLNVTAVTQKTDFSHEYTVSSLPNWSTSVAQSRSGEILSQQRCEVHQAVHHTDQLERGDQDPLMSTSMSCYASKSLIMIVMGLKLILVSCCSCSHKSLCHWCRSSRASESLRAIVIILCFNLLCSAVGCPSFATLVHLHPDVLVKSKVLQHRKHLSLPRHPVARLEHLHSVSQWWVRHSSSKNRWWRVDAEMHKVFYRKLQNNEGSEV